jgi:hypothetical protein
VAAGRQRFPLSRPDAGRLAPPEFHKIKYG